MLTLSMAASNLLNVTNDSSSVTNCLNSATIHKNSSPSIVFTAIATSYLSIGIGSLAIFGNLVFLYIVYSVRRLRTTHNLLLVFLALTDLSIGLFSVPLHVSRGVLWSLHRYSCHLEVTEQILYLLLGGFSLIGVLILTLDRLLAVMFPLKRKTWNLLRVYVTVYIFLSFAAALGIVLWKMQVFNQNQLRVVLACLVCLSLLTISLSYVKIYRLIQAAQRRRAEMMSAISARKRTSILTSWYVTLLVILFYLPRPFITAFEDEEALYHYMRWTALLIFSNSAVNPAIYFYRKEDIRNEFSCICQRLRRVVVRNDVSLQ